MFCPQPGGISFLLNCYSRATVEPNSYPQKLGGSPVPTLGLSPPQHSFASWLNLNGRVSPRRRVCVHGVSWVHALGVCSGVCWGCVSGCGCHEAQANVQCLNGIQGLPPAGPSQSNGGTPAPHKSHGGTSWAPAKREHTPKHTPRAHTPAHTRAHTRAHTPAHPRAHTLSTHTQHTPSTHLWAHTLWRAHTPAHTRHTPPEHTHSAKLQMSAG